MAVPEAGRGVRRLLLGIQGKDKDLFEDRSTSSVEIQTYVARDI